jgi:DNA-binding winged helix-turn-helix (wHTH) protein
MSRRTIYSLITLVIALFFVWMFFESDEKDEDFSERVKISLRNVGHQLLLSNQDSTSLVLPVIALEDSKYKLSFQNKLSFEPGNLVSIVQNSFKKSTLPTNYLVEVIQCEDDEVSYSYEMKNTVEKGIIPCRGRFLPENCYTIEVRFTNKATFFFRNQTLLYILIFSVFLVFQFFFHKRKQTEITEGSNEEYAAIGRFKFYPEQNKLVKEAIEINLSKKECELLEIFVANPNQIIKRDELMKKVWEDNGVFVGRSLDTYISKLRKKLQGDTSVKLTNIHGVGYKLEVNH